MSYEPLTKKLTELTAAASPGPLKAMRGVDGMMTISAYRDDDWQTVAKFVVDTTMRSADEANAALAAPAHEYAAVALAAVTAQAALVFLLDEGRGIDSRIVDRAVAANKDALDALQARMT